MSDDAIDATAHGAGENFPLDDRGEQLDSAPVDNKPDPIDRRVELFFFDSEFGITPPPPGQNSKAGSTEYPTWRKRVSEIIELRADDLDGPKVTFIEMADAHFRTNSAVVLPEGEDPDKTGAHQALTSFGIISTALRFNEDHPGRTLLVAGHTDTTNTPAFNQPLSEERAQLTLAMLEGGDASRESFKTLAQARHTVADIKQILSWAASALPGFDCDPGPIDDNLASAAEPIRNFQTSYNAQRATIAPSSTADLNPDGSVGPLTWGAIFDCYEFALQDELGETADGVAALRAKLKFVDPDHKSLGFSEYFPIEELGVDNFRSQTNRRVEIHFFEQGEEPDIQHAVDDPETSDLYLPGHYERTALPATPTVKRPNVLDIHLRDATGVLSSVRVSVDFGFERVLISADAVPDSGLSLLRFTKLPDAGLFSVSYRDAEGIETVVLADLPFAALAGAPTAPLPNTPPAPIATTSSEAPGFDPDAYLEAYTVL